MRWNVRACGWVRRGEELEEGRAMLDEYWDWSLVLVRDSSANGLFDLDRAVCEERRAKGAMSVYSCVRACVRLSCSMRIEKVVSLGGGRARRPLVDFLDDRLDQAPVAISMWRSSLPPLP